MFAYYGLDWIAAVTLWLHIYLLGKKRQAAWPLGLVAVACFFVLGLMTYTWGTVVSEVVVFALMLRSWQEWRQKERVDAVSEPTR